MRMLARGWTLLIGGGLALTLAAALPAEEAPQEAAKSAMFENGPGKALFQENCATCHDSGFPKAPRPYALRLLAPPTIISALEVGQMKQQAAHLSHEQHVQIAEYLTRTKLSDYRPPAPPPMCSGAAAAFDITAAPAAVGWGYDNRRFVPASVGGVGAADLSRLKLKWAFAFPNAAQVRSQPVVAMGAIFIGSQDGTVYALDLKTGCARWTAKADAEVRTAVVVEPWQTGTKPAHPPRVFFGDLLGRVYALDALTGKELWRARPDERGDATITGTTVPFGDTLYIPVSSTEVGSAMDAKYECCTFRGSVTALDLATGALKWRHFTVQEEPRAQGKTSAGTTTYAPSGAPVWGSPTIDAKRGQLYHGSGESYMSPADGNSDAIFAVDLKTGQRRWVHQLTKGDAWNNACMIKGHASCPSERGPDSDLAASPLLVDIGGGREAVIAGAKSGVVTAVDPDSGKLLWETRVGRGSLQGGIHFGMAVEGTRLYVPVYDSKDTPLGDVYSDPGLPGVAELDAATGKMLWRGAVDNRCNGRPDCEPGVSAAVTAIPGAVLAGHLDGWLRAYDAVSGKVIWQVDTTPPVKAVNGGMATGGGMSGPGPALSAGHLIVPSGYGFARKMPGNALLVYSLDGK